MKKLALIWLMLSTSFGCFAHGVDISTLLLIEQEESKWTLQLTSSIDAFRKEVKTHFADTPYQTPEEFSEQLLDHFKRSFIMSINGQKFELGEGVVNLGHETTIFYNPLYLPDSIASIKIVVDVFRDINRSKLKLLILKKGYEKHPLVLSHKNNYTADLQLEANKFLVNEKNHKEPQKEGHSFPYWLLVLGAIIIVIILFKKLNSARLKSLK